MRNAGTFSYDNLPISNGVVGDMNAVKGPSCGLEPVLGNPAGAHPALQDLAALMTGLQPGVQVAPSQHQDSPLQVINAALSQPGLDTLPVLGRREPDCVRLAGHLLEGDEATTFQSAAAATLIFGLGPVGQTLAYFGVNS